MWLVGYTKLKNTFKISLLNFGFALFFVCSFFLLQTMLKFLLLIVKEILILILLKKCIFCYITFIFLTFFVNKNKISKYNSMV